MEDNADTPRVCEACGGDKDTQPPCVWCVFGFQNLVQQDKWRKFRIRISKISGTYNLFQNAVEDIIKRIDDIGTEDSQALAIEGREILTKWLISDPGTGERDDAGRALSIFYKSALDFLQRS